MNTLTMAAEASRAFHELKRAERPRTQAEQLDWLKLYAITHRFDPWRDLFDHWQQLLRDREEIEEVLG